MADLLLMPKSGILNMNLSKLSNDIKVKVGVNSFLQLESI